MERHRTTAHPERQIAEASHDAYVALEPQGVEDESEGAGPGGAPQDGGEGVLRPLAGRRAPRDQGENSRAQETPGQPTLSPRLDASQVPLGPREGFVQEDGVVGSARQVSDPVRRRDQEGTDPRRWVGDGRAEKQEEPYAGSEESFPDHIRGRAEAGPRDRQVPAGGRARSQPGTLAGHEVGLRQGVAPVL